MPLQVSELGMLQDFGAQLVRCHDNVRYVAFALIGAVVLYRDPDSEIRVDPRAGLRPSVLWFSIGRCQYALHYNKESANVLLRRRTTDGDIVAGFSDRTNIRNLADVFKELRNTSKR